MFLEKRTEKDWMKKPYLSQRTLTQIRWIKVLFRYGGKVISYVFTLCTRVVINFPFFYFRLYYVQKSNHTLHPSPQKQGSKIDTITKSFETRHLSIIITQKDSIFIFNLAHWVFSDFKNKCILKTKSNRLETTRHLLLHKRKENIKKQKHSHKKGSACLLRRNCETG